MLESRIKIDYLGPHKIPITGQTGTSYSLTNIDFQRVYSDNQYNKKRKTQQEDADSKALKK